MDSDQMESVLVSRRFISWLAWFTVTYAILAGLLNFALEWYAVSFFQYFLYSSLHGTIQKKLPLFQ